MTNLSYVLTKILNIYFTLFVMCLRKYVIYISITL